MKGDFYMKKYLIVLTIITTIFVLNDLQSNEVVIPKEAIRFRVIANSNSKEDQDLKIKVKDNLQKDIKDMLQNEKDITTARLTLKRNIPTLKDNIEKTLQENNSSSPYTITYGQNYFPSKDYKGVVYNSGNYESLVVKIGKAEGNNFWCVLFPPLCLIDENEDVNKDTEYHLLVKDLLKKYF